MLPRSELLKFVQSTVPGAEVAPILGDASTRRFFRVVAPGGPSFVVMDYGAPFDGETDDIRMWRIFEGAGLPVAAVVRPAPEVGCLLLEDLGERTMESALGEIRASGASPEEQGRRTRDLYRRAVKLAVLVAELGTPVLARSERAGGPALDVERFVFEMDFFVEHYVQGLRGIADPAPALIGELHRLARLAAEGGRRVLCHRDFHARNLMLRRDGSLAMVDIQDARWGPDTYDLASLLRDAYIDLPAPLVDEMILFCQESTPGYGSDPDFRHRFDVVSAQRMIKVLGTFAYQTRVMRKDRYRLAIPRTLDRLTGLLHRLKETQSLGRLFQEADLFAIPSVS